jgi:sugar-specific transcriptional regulator TrmB
MSVISEDLINKLNQMGFTNYEAKAYLALVKNNPATGYEISNVAHVPRSVIYSTLRKLESRGYVTSVHEKPRRYIPLSPKQLLSRLDSDFSEKMALLREELQDFVEMPETEGFWNIRGYDNMLQICRSNIQEAEELICISGWKREVEELREDLLKARERGVEIIIFSFNDIDDDFGKVYSYGIDEDELREIWKPKLIIVTDSEELIMGSAKKEKNQQAIWTENRAVLNIALNYIILDITLYGQRYDVDISDSVMKLMTERIDHLDDLLDEKLDQDKKGQ